jgi:hypothetical protein
VKKGGRKKGGLRLDELLGTENPGHAPAGQAEALGQAVDDQDVVFVDVDDVFLGVSNLTEGKDKYRDGELTAALMVVPSQLLV